MRARRMLIRIAAGALILAIGLSRIYLGVHHATDVIAGYLVAAHGWLVWLPCTRESLAAAVRPELKWSYDWPSRAR